MDSALSNQFGFCRDGKVFINAYLNFPEREIGFVRNTESEALEYFVNRFELAKKKVAALSKEVEEVQNKGSFLTKVIQMKAYLAEFDGLGDFVPLFAELDRLEVFLKDLIANNQVKNLEIKRALVEDAKSIASEEDITNATDRLLEVKAKWVKTGPVEKPLQDALNAELDDSVIKVKELQREWKTVMGLPPKKQSMLWKNFKKANEMFFEKYNRIKGIEVKPRIDPRVHELTNMMVELEGKLKDQVNIVATAELAKAYLVKWKEITAQVKTIDRNLAERFRNVCDKIFEMNYLLRVISYRHPALNEKPRLEQLKIMINQMDYMTKKERSELEIFIADSEEDGTIAEKPVQSKINTQKRKISMKEMLLTSFKTELDAILNA